MKNQTKRLGRLIFCLLMGSCLSAHASTLLSYWNFNNNSPAWNNSTNALGSFSSTNGQNYGELYNSTSKRLSSNSANGTIYNGTNVYIDLSSSSLASTSHANGNFATTDGFLGWGVYQDASVNLNASPAATSNLAAGDASTQQGSLFLSAAGTKVLTLSLESLNYSGLDLSFAFRESTGNSDTMVWSYSLDGGSTFTSIGTSANLIGTASFNDYSLVLPTALDNKGSFLLQLTVTAAGSFAVDNLQLTAATAVPEPGTVGLLGTAALIVLGSIFPCRRVLTPFLKKGRPCI